MNTILLVCRSITYAKRVQRCLQGAGLRSELVRTPVGVASESCGYSIRVEERFLKKSLSALDACGLRPKKLLRRTVEGYEEVGA